MKIFLGSFPFSDLLFYSGFENGDVYLWKNIDGCQSHARVGGSLPCPVQAIYCNPEGGDKPLLCRLLVLTNMPVVFIGTFVYFFSYYLHTIMCTCPSIFTHGSVNLQFNQSPSASVSGSPKWSYLLCFCHMQIKVFICHFWGESF